MVRGYSSLILPCNDNAYDSLNQVFLFFITFYYFFVVLGEVGKYTKALKNLDIGWCQAVTDDGIRSLSATCSSLQYLGLIRCDSVTAEGVEELVEKYPHITYSTFILESKKLIERARREGFMFNDDQNHVDMLV